MKFNLSGPRANDLMRDVQVGDVYVTKSGRGTGDPRFQIIVGQRDNVSIYVGIDQHGNVTTAGVYYNSCYERRQRVGRVVNADEMNFDIEWEG